MVSYSDLSTPYERDNEFCDHGVERCLPCEKCEALKVEEEVEEVLEIAAPELSTVSG